MNECNITKQKQTLGNREQTGPPYQKGEGYGKRRHRGIGLRDTNYYA